MTELEGDITEEHEDDTDLVRKLRSVAKDQGKGLKAANQQLEELQAKVESYEKSAIFDQVGIPTEGSGKLFRDTFSGELDEAAVRSAAEEYGVIKPPEPTATQIEQQAHQGIAEASSTAPASPPGFEDKLAALDPNDPDGYNKVLQMLKETPGFEVSEGLNVS